MERDAKRVYNALEELREGYVIVEGKKDVKALEKLGILAYPYSTKTIEMANGIVYILTDLDREGERICREIEERLRENNRVERVDLKVRKVLASLLKLRRFEEISGKHRKFFEEVDRYG